MEARDPKVVSLDGIHCSFSLQQYPSGVIVLAISGTDIGEFGDIPMLRLNEYLEENHPADLFIDARNVRGASIDVSAEWARWLAAHKPQLRGVSMLTGTRFVEISAEFARRFAELQGTMRIYTEPAAFDAAVAQSLSV